MAQTKIYVGKLIFEAHKSKKLGNIRLQDTRATPISAVIVFFAVEFLRLAVQNGHCNHFWNFSRLVIYFLSNG